MLSWEEDGLLPSTGAAGMGVVVDSGGNEEVSARNASSMSAWAPALARPQLVAANSEGYQKVGGDDVVATSARICDLAIQ